MTIVLVHDDGTPVEPQYACGAESVRGNEPIRCELARTHPGPHRVDVGVKWRAWEWWDDVPY